MRFSSTSTYNATEVDDRPGFYYVSIVDGDKFALLSGPYTTHHEALGMVQAAKDAAYRMNSTQCAFAGFGTCRLDDSAGAGILNKHGMI
jgi:hypothetical protein